MYKQSGIKKSILFIIAIAILSVGYSQNTNSANGEKSTELVAFEKPSKKVLKKAKKSLDKGLKSKSKGKIEDALKRFNYALEVYPEYADAHFQKGLIHFDQNNMESASSSFKSAALYDNSNTEAFYYAGKSLFNLK